MKTNKLFRKGILISYIFMALIMISGCSEEGQSVYSRDIFALDTVISYQIISEDETLAELGLDAVEEAFMEVHHKTNRFDSESDVFAVNKDAGIAPVKVSADVMSMVETSIEWSDKTDGAFNTLIGSVMDLWDFKSDNPAVPSDKIIAEALTETDYKEIILNKNESTIFLPDTGMVMDLGGVAKGYATDKAVDALKELGIENAMINAGGNVYAMGTKLDGVSWKVGMQDPENPESIAALFEVRDMALVSSGNYRRYFEIDGTRYHHILDPATGYPSRASAATTVIMESATIADILSTALFVKGSDDGTKFAEDVSQIKAAIIITEDGTQYPIKDIANYKLDY